MAGCVIHVYHEEAHHLADAIRTVAPDRDVIAVATRAALAACLPSIELLFAPMPPRDGWATATRLRLIQLLGAGVDQLLPSPDLAAHVEVAGVRGVFAADVAEHALALMLAHARDLPAWRAQQHARTFDAAPRPTLAGATIAILGMGAIGQRLAHVARALGMVVRSVARTARVIDGFEVGADPRSAVVGARFVVVTMPLTPATHHLVDHDLLAVMSPDAFVVNVGRGGVVDETALLHALKTHQLAGAALDVFETEPLPPTSPLWTAPNLTITPHVAGLGEDYVARCIMVLIDNARRLDRGQPRHHLVDRATNY